MISLYLLYLSKASLLSISCNFLAHDSPLQPDRVAVLTARPLPVLFPTRCAVPALVSTDRGGLPNRLRPVPCTLSPMCVLAVADTMFHCNQVVVVLVLNALLCNLDAFFLCGLACTFHAATS